MPILWIYIGFKHILLLLFGRHIAQLYNIKILTFNNPYSCSLYLCSKLCRKSLSTFFREYLFKTCVDDHIASRRSHKLNLNYNLVPAYSFYLSYQPNYGARMQISEGCSVERADPGNKYYTILSACLIQDRHYPKCQVGSNPVCTSNYVTFNKFLNSSLLQFPQL